MNTLGLILFYSFIGSVVSLIGGVILLAKKGLAERISHFLASFAAGALLGAACFDLLPEALAEGGTQVFGWLLIGIIFFFVLERFLHWFHPHDRDEAMGRPDVALIVIGDTIHNFIDGVVIAGTFLVNPSIGVVTALAVAAHEIPQEIGDFGLLLSRGVSRRKVLIINAISALATMVGAVLTYYLRDSIEGVLPAFLAMTAGFFIYIALSDIVPEIHEKNRARLAVFETSLLLFGAFIVWAAVNLLE